MESSTRNKVGGESAGTAFHERRARVWDRWTMASIVFILLVPLPIARFESWPGGDIVLDRPIMPWSHFQICYISYPDGMPVEEFHTFQWNGRLENREASYPVDFVWLSAEPAVLKWQNAPEIVLVDLHGKGETLRMKTFWRPVLLWPFEALWRLR